MAKFDNSSNNSSLDSITIVKSEPFDQDLCDTNESSVYCETVSSDSSLRQQVEYKTEYTSDTTRMYKCEECGHMNRITQPQEDGFFDNSQAIEISHVASAFQVSIDPTSKQLKSNPVPSQSNQMFHNQESHSGNNGGVYGAKKVKRLSYPGDVGADEELEDETAQKYLAVLRKKVMEQRKQTRTLTQQNRRQQQRIVRLKSMMKAIDRKNEKMEIT
ncbi:uncharacterized protein LOC119082521 [Bradysia coprophila]|uniref:uncharacterized protein LOC119082521 n=1 Tax=Bradysia coprophila TaxID=38358 RepID=UPI00187D8CF6|nr:uncharacterized protein LOC119082521 [Bradysia coprophila]